MKKFVLGLLSVAIAGVVAFPGNVGAVKADSYYEDFPTDAQMESMPDLYQMKQDLMYADFFHQAEVFGDMLGSIYELNSGAYRQIADSKSNQQQQKVKKNLDSLTAMREKFSGELDYVKDPQAAKILADYLKALNKYKIANSYLVKYYNAPSQYHFDMFLKSNSEAGYLALYAKNESTTKYNFYMNKSINTLTEFGY